MIPKNRIANKGSTLGCIKCMTDREIASFIDLQQDVVTRLTLCLEAIRLEIEKCPQCKAALDQAMAAQKAKDSK